MTHRPIAPIAINGFEPGGKPRAYPIFEDVDPRTLLVDEGYQRDSSERSLKLVRKIVAGWDWAKFKSPVAVLTDAGLELIDGQHTAIAAATHPDIAKIPVMIVEVPERQERASAFIGHNKDRVAVTASQMHVAALMAGDAEAAAVQRVCDQSGVKLLRIMPGSGRYKPAESVAVSAIATLVRGRGERVIEQLAQMIIKSLLYKAVMALIGFSSGGPVGVVGAAGGMSVPTFPGYASGGDVGGPVSGPGTGTSDSILARVSNGEFIVNADATAKNYGLLQAINSGSTPLLSTSMPASAVNDGSAVNDNQMSAAPASKSELVVRGIDPKALYTGDMVRALASSLIQFQKDGGKIVLAA